MKTPFVRRSTLDAERSLYDGLVTAQQLARVQWQTEIDTLRQSHADAMARATARYDALLDKYHSLKVTGAAEPAVPLTSRTPDALEQAVITASIGKSPAVAMQMRRALANDRALIATGMLDEADVLARIQGGVQLVGVPG